MTTGRINQVCALPNAAMPRTAVLPKVTSGEALATGKCTKLSKPLEAAHQAKPKCKPQQKVSRKSHKMAPYCITMLLTPDYGERAKGKPEAPKAQTPYYCTGPKPC